jgi:hypothetical protein
MRVEFENYQIKTRIEKDKKQVFDIVRNKWIILNPEEQVRQVWLHFFVNLYRSCVRNLNIGSRKKIDFLLK